MVDDSSWYITALPYSKNTVFNEHDLIEVLHKVMESGGEHQQMNCKAGASEFKHKEMTIRPKKIY